MDGEPAGLALTPMSESEAREVLGWRYPPPYDALNPNPETLDEDAAAMADLARLYFAARDPAGRLAGFCCFGPEARVPGFDYPDDGRADIGLGLRPELTGRGLGGSLLSAATGLAAGLRLAPGGYRATVWAENARSRRLFERAGYRELARFRSTAPTARPYVVLARGP